LDSSSESTTKSSQVDLIRVSADLNRTNLIFEFSSQTRLVKILYCSLDSHVVSKCPFYISSNRLEVIRDIKFLSGNVLLKLSEKNANNNNSRYFNLVISNSESKVETVRVQSSNNEFPKLIAKPIEAASPFGDYTLSQNDQESPCFWINRTTGWVFMNCQDDQSSLIALTISSKQLDSVLNSYLRVDLSEQTESIGVYSFVESILDGNKVNELIKYEEQQNLTSIQSYLSHIYPQMQPESSISIINYNSTYINLSLTIDKEYPDPNTPIYRIDPRMLVNSGAIFLFDWLESSQFRFKNILDGVLYLASDFEIPWSNLDMPIRYQLKLALIETSLIEVQRHEVNVDIFVKFDSFANLKPPMPRLKLYEYEVEIDKLTLEKNNDLEIVKGFEWNSEIGVYEAHFEIKQDNLDDDFPFYVQQSRLYFSNSLDRNLRPEYVFKVLVKFKSRINQKE
jgi:hypothetical protein